AKPLAMEYHGRRAKGTGRAEGAANAEPRRKPRGDGCGSEGTSRAEGAPIAGPERQSDGRRSEGAGRRENAENNRSKRYAGDSYRIEGARRADDAAQAGTPQH